MRLDQACYMHVNGQEQHFDRGKFDSDAISTFKTFCKCNDKLYQIRETIFIQEWFSVLHMQYKRGQWLVTLKIY